MSRGKTQQLVSSLKFFIFAHLSLKQRQYPKANDYRQSIGERMVMLAGAAAVLSQNHMAQKKKKKRERTREREKYIHRIPLKVIRQDSVQGSDGLDNRDLSFKRVSLSCLFLLYIPFLTMSNRKIIVAFFAF